jgi:hypothetical protein
MCSDGGVMGYIELSESAAADAFDSDQLIQLAEILCDFADQFVDRTVHATRAETGNGIRQNA